MMVSERWSRKVASALRRPALPACALALGWFSTLAPGVEAQVGTASSASILEIASERYESFQTFCADFRQRIDIGLLRRGPVLSSGVLCQAGGDRFEMRFSDPVGDRLVADGTHLWTYFRSVDEGQVTRTTLARSGARVDLHREFLSDPGERYDSFLEGVEQMDGRGAWVISLRPVSSSPYRSARVWIDQGDYLIRRIMIEQDSDYIRTLDLSNLRANPSLPPDWFRYTPPRGVQVIDL
jgi:outer membrane lipoprotein carrier protein